MKLYDLPSAPNPRRERIFVAEKGLDLPTDPVDVRAGANRTPEFLARNPFGGLLPVLELDDGSCISESVAICRYLEGMNPEPPLLGVDAHDSAIVEMWNRRMEWELFRNVGDSFRHSAPFFANRYVQSAEAQDARRLLLERLPWLDVALAGRPFVAGDRFTIAGITAWVSTDLGIPSAFEIPSELEPLSRWFEEVTRRPSTRA